jgi:uncharacterized protein YjbJ (UPF0337 family)
VTWDQVQGNWKRFKVSAKQRWTKLDEAQLSAIAGRRALLAGRIRDAYGITLAEAEQQLADWLLALGLAPAKGQ